MADWYENLPASPAGDATALQVQLQIYQAQQTNLKNQIAILQKTADGLKGTKNPAAVERLAGVNAQLKKLNAQITQVGSKVNDVQNKVYEATGQYEKLLSGSNRDAFLALQTAFKDYGLESLAGNIYDYVKNGYSSDTISLLLQDTKEYKERFAANDLRVKAGLPVIPPSQYISMENSFRAALRQSGLPEGFYDSKEDFTDWIAKDVSPTEMQSRIDLATQATALANPYYKRALNQIGIDDGHMAAYFLDANKAIPLLQKAAATAAVGAAALQQGLTFNQSYAEQLATSGISASEAQQGYSQVANELPTLSNLGNIYGQQWSQAESEQSVFGTNAAATQAKAGLLAKEKGAFSGGTGAARGGLAQKGGAR